MIENIKKRVEGLVSQGNSYLNKIGYYEGDADYWFKTPLIPELQRWIASVTTIINQSASKDSYFFQETDRIISDKDLKNGVPYHSIQKLSGLLSSFKEELELGLLTATKDEILKNNHISKTNHQTSEYTKEFSNINDTWQQIRAEYGFSKSKFAKKINFIEKNTRALIYRDIAHAFYLSKIGFNKSAIILAGSIIEELLRNFLISNEIKPRSNKFDDYIRQCEENELLKEVIGKLSHSVRIFRNFVHVPRELESPKLITKPTAIGAVSNIFTIVNNF